MKYALLAWFAAQIAWSARRSARQYATFKLLTETRDRQRRYLRWLLQSLVFHSTLPLVALALVHRVGAIVSFPPELAALPPDWGSGIGYGIVGGVGGGLVLQLLLLRFRKRPPVVIGDILTLLPRNGAERAYGAGLSIAAGFGEELLFRLLLPLLLALCGAPPLVAMFVPVVVFGLAHVYQGVAGIIGTMVLGALFAFVYVGTRQLWVAMLMHAVLDLNTLVLRTWLLARRQSAGQST